MPNDAILTYLGVEAVEPIKIPFDLSKVDPDHMNIPPPLLDDGALPDFVREHIILKAWQHETDFVLYWSHRVNLHNLNLAFTDDMERSVYTGGSYWHIREQNDCFLEPIKGRPSDSIWITGFSEDGPMVVIELHPDPEFHGEIVIWL